MNMDKRIGELEKAISPDPIVWDEIKTYSMDQQNHSERYREEIVNQYTVGRVIFIEKQLVKK